MKIVYESANLYMYVSHTFLYHPHGKYYLYRQLYFSSTLTTKHFKQNISTFYIFNIDQPRGLVVRVSDY